jgi:hypothetical protein
MPPYRAPSGRPTDLARISAENKAMHARISAVKPSIDTAQPREFKHLQFNRKKAQLMEGLPLPPLFCHHSAKLCRCFMRSLTATFISPIPHAVPSHFPPERFAQIDHDNQILLDRMSSIVEGRGSADIRRTRRAPGPASLNAATRKRELARITAENQAILRRIQERHPDYSRVKLQQEWAKTKRVMANLCVYPMLLVPANGSGPSPKRAGTSPKTAASTDDATGAVASAADYSGDASGAVEDRAFAEAMGERSLTQDDSRSRPQPDSRPLLSQAQLEEICREIHSATAELGTDEADLARAILRIPPGQADAVMATYQALFEESLMELLKDETSLGFEDLLLSILADPAEEDARALSAALHVEAHTGKKDTDKIDEDTLIEVLCTRTKAEVAAIVPAFDALIAKEVTPHMPPGGMPVTLRTEIDSPSGPREPLVKRILLAILDGSRDDEPASPDLVDAAAAQRDADALHAAITDEATLVEVFTKRSFAHLAAVSASYRRSHGSRLADDVAEAFEKRSSSGLAVRLLALCGESLGSPAAFLIHDAVSGMGTDDAALDRVMVRLSTCADRSIVADLWRCFPDVTGKPKSDPIAVVKGDVGPGHRRALFLAILEQGQPQAA